MNFFNNDLKVSQRRTSCVSLVAQEEKWKRRVDALDTAIEIYLEKGYLHNDKQITITKGNPYCTTAYGNVRDQSHRDAGTWSDVAVYPLGSGNKIFWIINYFRHVYDFTIPLRSKKAGRVEKLLGFARSHSILTRG